MAEHSWARPPRSPALLRPRTPLSEHRGRGRHGWTGIGPTASKFDESTPAFQSAPTANPPAPRSKCAKAEARGADGSPTQRLSRCITGADRGGGLPSPCAHGALRSRGPAHRRSDARSRSAPLAAASPLATEVRPATDSACRHSCASRRGPCRRARRVARRRAALADPGDLTLSRGGLRPRRPIARACSDLAVPCITTALMTERQSLAERRSSPSHGRCARRP